MQKDIINVPRLFYCYSPVLKKQLINNGFKYITRGTHNRTNKTFWIFNGTEELNNFLKQRREDYQKRLAE